MNEMITKAFSHISDKVEEVLKAQGFKREKVATSDKEMVSLYIGESVAYSVIYFVDKMHVVLRTCTMTDEGPDNEWKSMATWMFDPESDTMKEAESIASDFVEVVSSTAATKRVKQTKKKKGDEGSANPLFLAKRFVTYFPELRDELKAEQEAYAEFRAVTFTREKVVPCVNKLLATGTKGEKSKFANMLSTQYANGDMDTRSIVTIVVLNSVEEKYIDVLNPLLSEQLQKAWTFARKLKGKKIKPEKPKKSAATYGGNRL